MHILMKINLLVLIIEPVCCKVEGDHLVLLAKEWLF